MKRLSSGFSAFVTVAFLLLARPDLCAASCQERCFKSFMACAASKAPSCTVNGRPLGTHASRLSKAIELIEVKSLFDSSAKVLSEEECEEMIEPCEEIEIFCHANCDSIGGENPQIAADQDVEMDFTADTEPQAAAPAIPRDRKTGILRIFADHPQIRVYLDELEIPVKPEGGDVESLVTPDIAVGKYWVKLIALDGNWQWEGEVDVKESKTAELKGSLVNSAKIREEQDEALKKYKNNIWREIKKLESDKDFNAAISAYESFMEIFKNYKAQCARAKAKLQRMKNEYEKVLIDEILEMTDANKLQRLCSQYFADYPGGKYLDTVKPIADEIRVVRLQNLVRMSTKSWFKEGCGESPTGKGGAMCYFSGGNFTMGYDD